MDTYYYYISARSATVPLQKESHIPKINKIKRSYPIHFKMDNKEQSEGPYDSLDKLKKNSTIYASIKDIKVKSKICQKGNIEEIVDYIIVQKNEAISIPFLSAIHHATVGTIKKGKVKGIHFRNPEHSQIINIISIDKETAIYRARVAKVNDNGKQVLKESPSTFFPDAWNINRLFHECQYAFENKQHIEGKRYIGKTKFNISVEFIINSDGKIHTCYPLMK